MQKRTVSIIDVPTAITDDCVGKAVSLSSGAAVLGNAFGVVVEQNGTHLSVAVFGGNAGTVEVKAGGTIAAGDLLKADASTGVFTAISTGDIATAIAVEAGASDELVEAVLLPPPAATGAYLTKAEADDIYAADGDYLTKDVADTLYAAKVG